MNAPSDATDAAGRAPDRRVRFELFFASAWLGFGLFVLPALIYAVGVAMLGPYGEAQGLGAFYADFFRDLGEPSERSWAIALGPLVMICLARAVFVGARAPVKAGDTALHKPPARPAPEQKRVEPRVGLD